MCAVHISDFKCLEMPLSYTMILSIPRFITVFGSATVITIALMGNNSISLCSSRTVT